MSEKRYDESSIQVLEGLEAVRKRPGMYIGSTDARGLHHLVWEILDNSIDEALSGYGNQITIHLKSDNSIVITDEGRGMPYKMHKSGRPTTEIVFCTLHAGGKFGDSGYAVSGGLHGVGSAVVNALSSMLEVTVYRDGGIWRQTYEKGGSIISKLENLGPTRKTGTSVWFKPDPKIFSTTIFNSTTIKERIRESAFLIKGLKIVFKDDKAKETVEFCYEEGLKQYVDFLNEGKTSVSEVHLFDGDYKVEGSHTLPIHIDCAFQFCETYSENIYSYVNNVRTRDGGTHETGFKTALTKAFNDYARKYNYIKEKEDNLDGVDIREGLTAVISLRIPEELLEFEGQTKNKLGSPAAKNATEQITYEQFSTYFEENPAVSKVLVEKAVNAKRAREAARKARDKARAGKSLAKKEMLLSGKLTPAQSKDYEQNELFLVEGDSAGGSAKQARNRNYQAILPLRGKVINAEKATVDQMLKNEEIATMINTIGADFGDSFDIKKMKYGKVIIMTDADTDGAHIQILLLTFFFRFMPELVEAGRLYLAQPPLYKLTNKRTKKVQYFWQEENLRAVENLESYYIQRFKGLGEMNSDQLWETTMDPKNRHLIRVEIDDFSAADTKVSILMGDEVAPRREWIESNVDFEVTDDFDLVREGS